METHRLSLVFDGTCGFCTRAVTWIERLDSRGRIDAVPFQNRQRRQALGLSLAECESAAWTVRPDGSKQRGHAAIFDAVGWAIGLKGLARLVQLPLISNLMGWLYRWVARNRHRFPGKTPHCRQHPEDCS